MKKHRGRRNKVDDVMVDRSHNLKGFGPNGGGRAGEQVQPDPAAILCSIPPSYVIRLALERLHTDDTIAVAWRLRSSRRLVRSFESFAAHGCLSRHSKNSTVAYHIIFGVTRGDGAEGHHSRVSG